MSELPPAPSTRRTLAARLPGPLGRIIESLRRALERGDARLGLFVGVPMAVLVAWAFAAGWGPALRLDLVFLDQAFRLRPPIREAEPMLMVDLNEETHRVLTWPIKRGQHAGVLLALRRLGVARTVLDIEFKTVAPRPTEYDHESGEYLLTPDDVFLRDAIAATRKVTLAYHFDLAPEAADLRLARPRMADALEKKFTASIEELAEAGGLPSGRLREEGQAAFQKAAEEVVRRRLDRNPALTFAQLRQELLPGDAGQRNPERAKNLQFAYWTERGIRAIADRTFPLAQAGPQPDFPVPGTVIPPLFPFLQGADSVAAANMDGDLDSVKRRPWVGLLFRGSPHLYLGLEGALRRLAGPGETVQATLGGGELRIDVRNAAPGAVGRTVTIPVDREGRILVDWTGNADRTRGAEHAPFTHVPFHLLLSFFEERYLLMDANFRKLLAAVSQDSGEPFHPEYGALSARLADFLSGKGGVPPDEVAAIEEKMDAVRLQVLSEMEAEAAEIEKAIPALKSQRAKDNSTQDLLRRRAQIRDLRAPYDQERMLRPLVEGKIAWVGQTAQGADLHPTPLGPATPGVDVLANLANMVLTGQAIRRAPPWRDFVYILLVGLFVSYAVTHWNTVKTALPATIALAALSTGLYGVLFVRGSTLISGGGPVAASVIALLSVGMFKEIVTQRSQRKLQRELERNTSPEMVKILMEHPEFLSKPRKMTGTFFFTDVKGFTSISEKMTPEVLFPFINRMLDASTQALKAHQAYIDKYVGDGVVALFGMPVASPDHARNACLAALDCQVRLKALNEEFDREGLPQVRVRIGVNSGDVNAGNMGAADRSSYTAMGDPINLASRLEGANKNYDTYIMIGESTLDLVQGQFVVRELDRIRVVGKQQPVRVYELIAVAGAPLPFPPGFLEGYDAALKLFQARRWRESMEAFQALLGIKPDDKPCKNYVGRAGDFLAHPPPADEEIVFELHSK